MSGTILGISYIIMNKMAQDTCPQGALWLEVLQLHGEINTMQRDYVTCTITTISWSTKLGFKPETYLKAKILLICLEICKWSIFSWHSVLDILIFFGAKGKVRFPKQKTKVCFKETLSVLLLKELKGPRMKLRCHLVEWNGKCESLLTSSMCGRQHSLRPPGTPSSWSWPAWGCCRLWSPDVTS